MFFKHVWKNFVSIMNFGSHYSLSAQGLGFVDRVCVNLASLGVATFLFILAALMLSGLMVGVLTVIDMFRNHILSAMVYLGTLILNIVEWVGGPLSFILILFWLFIGGLALWLSRTK